MHVINSECGNKFKVVQDANKISVPIKTTTGNFWANQKN